ncbi:hypothetical protein XpopCFBP1817_05580 [Xanthomonas populi]|uniref:Uncharacterized protein n=1 Tax=Xanthomonas populi TaxID=53414 RepID=A0A2S7EV99_9XANT|nr:hypothetical protein XpopCFBP1817_05580 [Xanthomonas populi]
MLKSEAFIKAPRMGRLLRYLVEQVIFGDTRNTNEYAIGIAVFDRDPAQYQPAEDPVVRVQVGRLRQRLNAYYCMQGAGAALAIKIPVGRYMPVIARQNAAASVTSSRLMIHPIHYIAERGEGKAFADGLYEELLDQLFQAFGEVFTVPLVSSVTQSERGASAELHARAQVQHSIEGSLRIDAQRIRASIRIVDSSLRRIMWARHFDRSIAFGIQQQ